MACGVGAQVLMTSFKYAYTYSHYDLIGKKANIQKFQFFFNRNYKTFRILRGFEQLSSSIGWYVMAFSQNGQCYL